MPEKDTTKQVQTTSRNSGQTENQAGIGKTVGKRTSTPGREETEVNSGAQVTLRETAPAETVSTDVTVAETSLRRETRGAQVTVETTDPSEVRSVSEGSASRQVTREDFGCQISFTIGVRFGLSNQGGNCTHG